MVWGYIKGNGERKLVKIDGTLNSEKYKSILREHLLSGIADGETFQQDGSSSHISRATKMFLTKNGVNLLENWPLQSLDLSIIEPLWGVLKKNIIGKKSKECLRSLGNFPARVGKNPNETNN